MPPAGVALVIVISLVALLTVVSVALLLLVGQSTQRTASEVAAHQSEALAQTAFETLLADLGDEMAKGSSGVSVNVLAYGAKYLQYDLSGKREGMRVSKSLRSGAPVSGLLVKQSQADTPFHAWTGAPAPRAAAVSTGSGTVPFAPALWDMPRFLAPGESFANASAPQWVFISRNGSNPKSFSLPLRRRNLADGSANPTFVLGRYAFNLYETAGLLDINAAGYPAGGVPDAERVGRKGSQALADLTMLPGLTPAAVDALSGWRHQWQGDAQEFVRQSESVGWRKMVANDNAFLGRQDMLDFSKQNAALLPAETLRFFTHFSRDLDAPSYRPLPVAGPGVTGPTRTAILRSLAAGGNDAHGFDSVVNPDLTAFDAARKRPLVPRRFPLERLKYVATPAGSTVDAETAKFAEKYFGLVWRGTFWEYVHLRSNGDIYTLQDVPVTREANFFEILRATVLAGSLGRQYAARGHDALDQQRSMHRLLDADKLGGFDGTINLNIMEMGACIIDQHDADSYPTPLRWSSGGSTYQVFGKEDVPYLQRLSAIPFRGKEWPKTTVKVYNAWNNEATASQAYEVSMVLQPMLWRLHQPTYQYAGPTNFRVRPVHVDVTGGGSLFWMYTGWDMPNAANTGVKTGKPLVGTNNVANLKIGDYSYWGAPNYRVTQPELYPKTFNGSEFLDVTVPFASNAFREPQAVHSPQHAAIAGYTIPTAPLAGRVPLIEAQPGHFKSLGFPTSFDQVAGFLVGRALAARRDGTSSARFTNGFFRGDPIEVRMEYQAADGSWRNYQTGEFTYKSNWSSHYSFEASEWQDEMWYWSSYLTDPRTPRFGGLATTLRHGMRPRDWNIHWQMVWPEGCALGYGKTRDEGVRPGWTAPASNIGWNNNAAISYWEPFNQGAVADNNANAWSNGFDFAYKDPDEVFRPGMAGSNEYGANQYLGNPMSRRYQISDTGQLSSPDSLAGRPQVLNRAFRSVAELAYAFRGTPWRNIDFLNPSSPDAGLLDVFSLYEPADAPTEAWRAPVVAGRVNLNSAGVEVIASLLAGVARDGDSTLSGAEATEMAKIFVATIALPEPAGGPLLSKAEVVARPTGQWVANPSTGVAEAGAISLVKLLSDMFSSATDRSITDRREAIARALADATTVRSWNFTLDLIVQSGGLPPAATTLEEFQPGAERRYWVHFALDRITGKLLDVQWERVTQ